MKKSESRQEPEKAPPGAIPTIIQPAEKVVCILPAKPKPASTAPLPKPLAAPPKPKLEPTLERRIANEVERRVSERVGNLAIGFLIGRAIASFFDKHQDGGCQ